MDSSGEQTSQEVKQFCNKIGTALRVLQQGTLWWNCDELYVGLIQETVSKDMRRVDLSFGFWEQHVEHRARVQNLTARNLFQFHVSNPLAALTRF